MNVSTDKVPVTRRDFVLRFMRDGGFTYAQACQIYRIFCSVLEDGIVAGSRVGLGNLGALVPLWKPPRDVHMHFRRLKGNRVQKGIHRTYYMDGRICYTFRLFKKFAQTHQLHWLPDFPDEADVDKTWQ